MRNLIEIEEDFVRSDLIAAITVDWSEDDDDAATLRVYLMGREEPLEWWFEKYAQAEKARINAVARWVENLPR